MANQDFNVLGNQRGKVGNIVGYVRKGRQFYRGYTRKHSTSKSEAAAIARVRFTTLRRLGLAFRGAISRGFQHLLKNTLMSSSNIFMKKNKDAVTLTSVDSEPSIDYGAFIMSEGNLPEVYFSSPNFSEEAEVSVPFDDNIQTPGAAADDNVFIVVFQPDVMTAIVSKASSRSAGSISVTVPERWSGMEVHVYGFCVNNDDRWDEQLKATIPAGEASPSTYIGYGNIS